MSKHCQLIASTANTKIICFLTAPTHTHTETSKPTHLTLSVSSPHPLCMLVCVVSRASYILCMQVKKKRKNKIKSKDKHVYRQRERERERQTDSLTAWKSVQEKSALAKEREWTSSCSLTFCDMICVLATCCQCWPGNSCLRNWAHEQLLMCTHIHTHACGQLLLSGTLATDLRWPSMRVVYLRKFVVVAMPSLASFFQMTSQRIGNIAKRCTASLTECLSLYRSSCSGSAPTWQQLPD